MRDREELLFRSAYYKALFGLVLKHQFLTAGVDCCDGDVMTSESCTESIWLSQLDFIVTACIATAELRVTIHYSTGLRENLKM